MYVGLENRMMRNHNISLAEGLIGVSEVWGGIIGFFISVTMKSKKKSCRLYEKVSSQRCVKWQSDFRNSWKSKWLNIKCKFSDISFFLIHSDYKLCYLEIWHKGLLIFTLFGFYIVNWTWIVNIFILQSVHLLYKYAIRINFCFIRTRRINFSAYE